MFLTLAHHVSHGDVYFSLDRELKFWIFKICMPDPWRRKLEVPGILKEIKDTIEWMQFAAVWCSLQEENTFIVQQKYMELQPSDQSEHCIKVMLISCTSRYDVMRQALHFRVILKTLKTKNKQKYLMMRKLRNFYENKEHSAKYLTSTHKTINDMKHKASLRSCHRPEETKKTWNLTAIWCGGSWILSGSWNRKTSLVEKLVKSK